MKRIKNIYEKVKTVLRGIRKDHVSAHAAQTAYFFMLCLIPIILLLLTLYPLYTGYEGGCNDGGDSGISDFGRFFDHIDCESGI